MPTGVAAKVGVLFALVVSVPRRDLGVLEVALIASLVDTRGTDRRVSSHIEYVVVSIGVE